MLACVCVCILYGGGSRAEDWRKECEGSGCCVDRRTALCVVCMRCDHVFVQPVYWLMDEPYHAVSHWSYLRKSVCKSCVCITSFYLFFAFIPPLDFPTPASAHMPPLLLGDRQLYAGHVLFCWIQNGGSESSPPQIILPGIPVDLHLYAKKWADNIQVQEWTPTYFSFSR